MTRENTAPGRDPRPNVIVISVSGDNNSVSGNWVAVGGRDATQHQVTSGYEDLARAVEKILQRIPELGLDSDAREDLECHSREVLDEVAKEQPDEKRLRRVIDVIKAKLMQLAQSAGTGANAGIHELAQHSINELQLPF